MAVSANLGFPRLGGDRELRRAVEASWSNRLPKEELARVARRLRSERWRAQREAGVDLIPSNDFSLYDHALDTAVLVGAVPERYRTMEDENGLATYF